MFNPLTHFQASARQQRNAPHRKGFSTSLAFEVTGDDNAAAELVTTARAREPTVCRDAGASKTPPRHRNEQQSPCEVPRTLR